MRPIQGSHLLQDPPPLAPPALPCSVPAGIWGIPSTAGLALHRGWGRTGLALALLGEEQAAAAVLSLPRAMDQQCHLGHRAVISEDTGPGWHLWPGRAAQGPPALLCDPLGTHGHAHRGMGSSPQG